MNPPIRGQYMIRAKDIPHGASVRRGSAQRAAGLRVPPASLRSHPAGNPRVRPALGVQRDLLAGRRKRPRDLQTTFLAKDETQLARWPQPLGMVGTVGRARSGFSQRAQEVLMKEAIPAARFRCFSAPTCHT